MKILPRAVVCLGVGGALALAAPSLVDLIEFDSVAYNADVENCAHNLSENPEEVDIVPEACKTFENSFTVKTETVSLGNGLGNYSGVKILSKVIKYELPSASVFKDENLVTLESASRRQQENRGLAHIMGGLCLGAFFLLDSFAEHSKSSRLTTNERASVA